MAAQISPPTNDQHVAQYGRRFSHYGLNFGVYGIPIDQREQTRLEDLDDLIRDVVGPASLFVSIPSPIPRQGQEDRLPIVLDCGCGSGRWARHLLQETGLKVDITAVDICLSQRPTEDDDDDDDSDEDLGAYEKRRWNLNLPFEYDRSRDRLGPEEFDIVHSRFLADGINASRWPGYVRDIRRALKRGGSVQMAELIPHIQSDDGRLRDDSALTSWWSEYVRVLTAIGKNIRVARDLERMLTGEGFERVRLRTYNIPIGNWARNLVTEVDTRRVAREMLWSLSLFPFMRYGGYTTQQFAALMAGADRELRDDSLKLYYKLYVVTGRRRPQRR